MGHHNGPVAVKVNRSVEGSSCASEDDAATAAIDLPIGRKALYFGNPS
jgi:hypothetical protein